ncbi:MAG: hypothetical protein HF973_11070 [Chloroflexi bacterium]|nr:hypothetical protein [Chloroflexota bacterium]
MHMGKTVVLGLFLLLLAACGGSAPESDVVADTAVPPPPSTTIPATKTPPPLPTTAPVDTAVPPTTAAKATEMTATEAAATEAPAADTAASVTDVTIPGAEGLEMQATLTLPAGSPPFPGVILLHMLGSDRQVWADNGFSQLLADNGYAVLALDMRGHGETGGSRDWDLAEEDLQMAWEWFTGLDEVAGEGQANIPEIKTVILLSPGLDYRGVTTDDAIAAYGNRPALIVASQEDNYAANSSETLADLAAGEAKLIMYNGAGHGTSMFGPQPDLAPELLDWLNSYLQK